jgi:hypothetical protein
MSLYCGSEFLEALKSLEFWSLPTKRQLTAELHHFVCRRHIKVSQFSAGCGFGCLKTKRLKWGFRELPKSVFFHV